MTNVEGVLNKDKILIEEISSSKIMEMIDDKTITEGMIPKINTCLDAVNNGVTAVAIIDGRKKHSVLFEIFSDNCWEAVWKIEKPTIAMIDGFALGGGCELAMSCDIRMATDRSMFGQPEINLGLIPGGGGTQRLTHLVGYGKSLELILSGNFIDAEEAFSFGLINHICSPDELRNKTIELAKTIGSKSSHTLKIAKSAVRIALNSPIDEGIQKELRVFSDLFDTEDKEIGVNAFLEKKTPHWKGR